MAMVMTMALRLKIIIFSVAVTALCFCFQGRSSAAPTYHPYWGVGFITPQDGHLEGLTLPPGEVKLYDSPSGKIIGFLGQFSSITHDDWHEVGYESGGLTYYQRRGQFILVLIHNSEKGFWISVPELEKVKFRTLDWLTFLLQDYNRGYYPDVDEGLILREKPSKTSKAIALLQRTNSSIELTGETNGRWGKVKATIPYSYCEKDYEDAQHLTGWIMLVDDKGFPNIWLHARGC